MHNLFREWVEKNLDFWRVSYISYIASLESVGGGLQIPESELSLVIGEFVIAYCHYDPGTSRSSLPFRFTSRRREYGRWMKDAIFWLGHGRHPPERRDGSGLRRLMKSQQQSRRLVDVTQSIFTGHVFAV